MNTPLVGGAAALHPIPRQPPIGDGAHKFPGLTDICTGIYLDTPSHPATQIHM